MRKCGTRVKYLLNYIPPVKIRRPLRAVGSRISWVVCVFCSQKCDTISWYDFFVKKDHNKKKSYFSQLCLPE